jgi:hypothetical protein
MLIVADAERESDVPRQEADDACGRIRDLERIMMRLVNTASHLISSHPSLTVVIARKEF